MKFLGIETEILGNNDLIFYILNCLKWKLISSCIYRLIIKKSSIL